MKNKIIAIMQPTYMPWMGYFSLINKVDEFIFLNSVQLVQRSWQVRNKIKLNDTEKMLTIPVEKINHRDNRMINNTRYVDERWKKSHLDTIKLAYKKSPFFEDIYSFLSDEYNKEHSSVGEFNIMMITSISRQIGISTPFMCSDEMNVTGRKDELLSNICKMRNATTYLSALGSAQYIEVDSPGGQFIKDGINVFYQNYKHPKYKQMGEIFIPYIGIYDLLFNVGFENALEIIKSGEKNDYSYKEIRNIEF